MLVAVHTAVVNQLIATLDVADVATGGLGDPTTIDGNIDGRAADGAAEVGHLEIGDDGTGADDHAADGKEGIDGVGVQSTHLGQLAKVVRSDLHTWQRGTDLREGGELDLVVHGRVGVGGHLIMEGPVDRFELPLEDEVHQGHNLGRIRQQLVVEALAGRRVVVQMQRVDVQRCRRGTTNDGVTRGGEILRGRRGAAPVRIAQKDGAKAGGVQRLLPLVPLLQLLLVHEGQQLLVVGGIVRVGTDRAGSVGPGVGPTGRGAGLPPLGPLLPPQLASGGLDRDEVADEVPEGGGGRLNVDVRAADLGESIIAHLGDAGIVVVLIVVAHGRTSSSSSAATSSSSWREVVVIPIDPAGAGVRPA